MLNDVVRWFIVAHSLLNDFIHNAKSVHRTYSERNAIKERKLKLMSFQLPDNTSTFAKPVSQTVIGVPAVHI